MERARCAVWFSRSRLVAAAEMAATSVLSEKIVSVSTRAWMAHLHAADLENGSVHMEKRPKGRIRSYLYIQCRTGEARLPLFDGWSVPWQLIPRQGQTPHSFEPFVSLASLPASHREPA